MTMTSIVTLIIVAALLLWAISLYNRLIALRNQIRNAFSQIDVQLQRRYDLIPNLVETAKTYLKHEKETLTAVIEARNRAVTAERNVMANPASGGAVQALAAAETALTGAMGKFMALAESYPDLKANTTMNELIEELSSTENRVAFARQAFNDSVTSYNTAREQFPGNIVANVGKFSSAEEWKVEDSRVREAVKASFN